MSPVWIAVAAFVGVIAFFCALMWGLAHWTGWAAMARLYGTDAAPPQGEKVRR